MRTIMPGDPRSAEDCVNDLIAFAGNQDLHGVEMVLDELSLMGFCGKIIITVASNPIPFANKWLIEKGIEKLGRSFRGTLVA